MNWKFWRNKRLLAAVIITIMIVAAFAFLATLKLDYDHGNNAALQYFASQPGMSDAFSALERLTPSDAVVLCWWDYGLAVREWSHREVIEAYPSREIADSVASTRSFWGNLEAQLFGTWGSNEKIRDIALAFMFNEEPSLQLLQKYDAKYVLVFVPDELEKFPWIAKIAGYNATDYLTYNATSQAYEPTTRAQDVTLLRLIYDDTWQPRHFTKIFNSDKAKIYRIDY
jgi:asparagine N-glycosylation enzyme membrane subunit Stt3